MTTDFQRLHPRVIDLWRIQHLVASAVMLVLLAVGAIVVAVSTWVPFPYAAGVWGAVALLRGGLLFWYPSRAYQAWGYRIDGKVLELREGVIFQTVTLLPLSRLQHVDLNRGPIERMLGLASLAVYTAGTEHAEIVVPGLGLDEAERLRDQLVAVGGDDAV